MEAIVKCDIALSLREDEDNKVSGTEGEDSKTLMASEVLEPILIDKDTEQSFAEESLCVR